MKTFIDNYHRINSHNEEFRAGKHTYYLSINQFSDMTEKEFASKTSCYDNHHRQKRTGATFLEPHNFEAPQEVDWRQHGYVTPVLDQGACGSCYAFSATGSLEGQMFRKTKKLVPLSQQNIVDCSGNHGCHGGWMDVAFDYIKKNGGRFGEIVSLRAAGKCRYDASGSAATVTGHFDVQGKNAGKLKTAVASVGPGSVAVNAINSFQFYGGGVYHDPKCNSTTISHAVLVVGYGADKASGLDYWIIKNSWGEKGYMRLARNKNNVVFVTTTEELAM